MGLVKLSFDCAIVCGKYLAERNLENGCFGRVFLQNLIRENLLEELLHTNSSTWIYIRICQKSVNTCLHVRRQIP